MGKGGSIILYVEDLSGSVYMRGVTQIRVIIIRLYDHIYTPHARCVLVSVKQPIQSKSIISPYSSSSMSSPLIASSR